MPLSLITFFGVGSDFSAVWFFFKNLSVLQKANRPFAQPHRHRRLAQALRTGQSVHFLVCVLNDLLLDLQTVSTRAAFLRHQRAKRIFEFFSPVRELPRFKWPERQRELRGHLK